MSRFDEEQDPLFRRINSSISFDWRLASFDIEQSKADPRALATLSVLRSNALSTGYTVAQSLLGTFIGFLAAAGLVSITSSDWFLWTLLPIAVFLSAYTPSAVHFVLGQASFTVFVVVLFNLLEPQGWKTGLVRLGDIAVGTVVSLVVSVLRSRPATGREDTIARITTLFLDGARPRPGG